MAIENRQAEVSCFNRKRWSTRLEWVSTAIEIYRLDLSRSCAPMLSLIATAVEALASPKVGMLV